MDYIAQPKDYWIAPNAINITRNALGKPNRIQCSVASGAAILCYIEGVDGLGYDNGHRFRTWPLTISPTYFNSNTAKYVYVAIPRTSSVGTQAVVVFPSEKLDIYGVNESDAQVGSTDYYYIWLQGILTATDGTSNRDWQQTIDFGKKGTDEDLYDDTSSDWYQYSKVSEVVTFLKNIAMKAGTTFHNLILGYKELTGVATSDTAYTDSDVLVATPGYVESQYLSKTHESTAQEQVGFLKGLWVGVRSLYEITANGIAKLKSVIAESVTATRIQTDSITSANYTGDGVADTGFRLTNAYNGHSKLTIDEIYVRMKAVFESLEVRERTYTGGDQIWSCAGNRIIRVDYLGNVETADHVPQMMRVHSNGRPASEGEQDDVYSVPVPGDTYGYSDVKVPWLLRQMPLLARAKVFARYRKVRIVINEPANNSTNRAAASESPLANIRRARCYFLAKDDDMEVHNWWRINDLARCQTMNLANITRKTYLSGEDEKAGNIFWWRKVIGVSYEPVTLDDGKQYHYFDVSFDYEYEQSHPEVMATSVMAGSDIPAAQDSVVQFGNTIIEGRMNLMMMEVNGGDAVGYNPTTDAPCLKAYRGIYCFDLNKSWVGGNPCKMKLSPKSGYEFYGPNFKQVTEYDVVPVPVERGLWLDIVSTRDDYREHAMVRKCYYYDKVSHNGSYWLCSIVDGTHWVDSSGNYISDADYAALSDAAKALCSRKQNYTIEEPSVNSTDWTEVVQKGDAAPYYVEDYGIGASRTSHSDISSWSSSQPSPTAQKPYVWKRTRLYNPNTQQYGAATYVCLTGEKGEQGEGGYGLSLTPASLILESEVSGSQELVNYVNNVVTVRVMKGSTPVQLTCSVLTGTGSHSSNISISGSNIPVNNAGTYSTVTLAGGINLNNGESGFFTVRVLSNDNMFSQDVRINFYVNRAVTFTREIKNGIETAMGAQTEYSYDQLGNVIKTAYQADIQTSAQGLTQQFTEQISRAVATGANLFGFHKDVVFAYAVPFIQGYGFVCNNHWNATDKTGRIYNLGMHGRLGYYTVRCLVRTSNSAGYVRLQMNWHEAVSGTQVSGGIKGVVYATTSEWKELTATFLFNNKNENHIGTMVPEGQAGSYEIGDINGYIDVGQISDSNNGTRIGVQNNRIYVRHLKVEYKDIATDFCEADEDVAYLGQGNVAKELSWNPYDTNNDIYPASGTGRDDAYCVYVNLNQDAPWGYDGDNPRTYWDYIRQSNVLKIKAGRCYTLTFWAKSSTSGFVISQFLFPNIITDIGSDLYVDASVGTIREGVRSDGCTNIQLSTTWKQYFVHLYATVGNGESDNYYVNVIPLRISKDLNGTRSGYVYMSDIELQEGYVTSAEYFASFISQNARRISLVQQSGTKLAGIDIQNGIVNLMADKVTFSNSTGTISGKVWIDPETGTLHAVDGYFSGTVNATSGTFANISISGNSSFDGDVSIKKLYNKWQMLANSTQTVDLSFGTCLCVGNTSESGITLRIPSSTNNAGIEIKMVYPVLTRTTTYDIIIQCNTPTDRFVYEGLTYSRFHINPNSFVTLLSIENFWFVFPHRDNDIIPIQD